MRLASTAWRARHIGDSSGGVPEPSRVTYVNALDSPSKEIPVSEQSSRQEFDQLERINAELTASLKNCRAILRDCHQKLAANSNDPVAEREQEDAGCS